MFPLILSLPVMNAADGLSSPLIIALNAEVEQVIVQ
jgi:hypothetical protein